MAIYENMSDDNGQMDPRRPLANIIVMKFDDDEHAHSSSFYSSSPSNINSNNTANGISSSSRIFMTHDKKQLVTPATTPLTMAETPLSEDSSATSDDRRSILSTPLHAFKNLGSITNLMTSYRTTSPSIETSTAPTNLSVSKSPEHTLEPCGRDPSPQQEGRTLFHEHSRDDFPVEASPDSLYHCVPSLLPEGQQLRLCKSAGPGIPASSDFFDEEKSEHFMEDRSKILSQSTSSHKLRSRRYLHAEEESKQMSISGNGECRRQSRLRSSSSRKDHSDTNGSIAFSLSMISIDDEVSVSSTEDSNMELSNNSSRRNSSSKNRTRQSNKQLSRSNRSDSNGNGGANNDKNMTAIVSVLNKIISKRLGTTKSLVWLLCVVGLASVSMIVMTNHKIGKSLDLDNHQYHDHVPVMFGKKKKKSNQRKIRRKSKMISDVPPPSNTLDINKNSDLQSRETLMSPQSLPVDYGSLQQTVINLHRLSLFQDEETKTDKKDVKVDSEKHTNVNLTEKDNKETEYHKTHKTLKKHKYHDKKKIHKHHNEKKKESTHHETIHEHSNFDSSISYDQSGTEVFEIKTFVGVPKSAVVTPVGMIKESLTLGIIGQYFHTGSVSTVSDGSKNRRVVMLDGFNDTLVTTRVVEQYPSPFSDNTQVYPILDSSDGVDERIGTMEIRAPYIQGECVPMADWQTTFHPSCNGMHELDLAGREDEKSEDHFKLFGKNGFWRNAWSYENSVGPTNSETVVLKTLKINHRFEDAHFEHNRIDAVVLERLTASPHVIDIFGFCGHSVLTEYADGKRLGELADKNKKIPLSRLKIALDIASGLADVHGIDGDEQASFVHLDINPANVVSIGGTLKLNDFNIGILRRWNTTSNSPCGIPAQYPNPQWRSPEEARGEQNLTEKVDVFSMGHIFFRLICGHEPWNKLEPGGMPSKDELNEKVKNGVLPTVPDEVMQSTDPEVVAIRNAMFQCYRYDPISRPSARSIMGGLRDSLAIIEGSRQSRI